MANDPPIPRELWDQVPAAAQAALLLVFQQLHLRIDALEQRVRELEERLNKNSANSSKPPSSDRPDVKRAPPRTPSGKKQGGQPGHALQQRPPLTPDRIVTLKPHACRRCQTALAGQDDDPQIHQVIELPPIRPLVTEYHLHRLSCPDCGASTCAPLPAGTPSGQYGPRLQAALAVLTGAYRLSKRHVEALCSDLLGVPISAGQVCALEKETAAALDPVVEPLRTYAQSQPGNIDETSWRERNKRAWLWVLVTQTVTVFTVALSRSGAVAREILGTGRRAVVTSDRYSAYNWLSVSQRQLCWAHLVRDFQAMVDRGGAGAAIGKELLSWAECVFCWWRRVRDGTGEEALSRATLQKYISDIRPAIRAELERGSVCGCAKTAGTCKELLRLWPALWTFVRVAGIEPTNNAAERALRHAVQWRKTSYGTASESGSHFVANVLTVVGTCRQQGRDVLEYLTACCRASLHGTPPPSLLPQGSD